MWCQVAANYVHLVTAVNNVDTVITLIIPSVMIIFSNVRISVALSQCYRDRHSMLAQDRRTEMTRPTGAAAAAAAAAASQESSSSSQSRRSQRRETAQPIASAAPDNTQHCSFNVLQMKVQRKTADFRAKK